MNTDGNTYAINRHLAEREEYDLHQSMVDDIEALRDEVDKLEAQLADAEAERDRCMDNLKAALDQRDAARSHVHKLAHDGDQFAAFMNPLDSQARTIHLREYRKWRKSVNDAWAAVFINEGHKDD